MEERESAEASVLGLLSVQPGHFRYESGYHGEIWLDLDRLFSQPRRLAPLARELATRLERHEIEAVVGPLVGGAFLAQMVAAELGVFFGHCEQRPAAVEAKLYPVAYSLPVSLAPLLCGKRVAIVDDVINAGSAVRGSFAALVEADAKPVVAGALLLLGRTALPFVAENGMVLERLAERPNPLWEPANCPLCAQGRAFGLSRSTP